MADLILGSTTAMTESGGTVTLDNGVQDQITRLGTVTAGTFEGTLNGNTTFSMEIPNSVKAWVTFEGDDTSSPSTIFDSHNVSSVTYESQGRYIINFTNALPSANYVAVGMSGNETGTTGTSRHMHRNGTWTTTACHILVTLGGDSGTFNDPFVGVAILGG